MLIQLSTLLLISVVSAGGLHPRQINTNSTQGLNTTQIPTTVSATFPSFGSEKGISGVLEFQAVDSGVAITSKGNTALHGFPAGQGPFSYHSIPHEFLVPNSSPR